MGGLRHFGHVSLAQVSYRDKKIIPNEKPQLQRRHCGREGERGYEQGTHGGCRYSLQLLEKKATATYRTAKLSPRHQSTFNAAPRRIHIPQALRTPSSPNTTPSSLPFLFPNQKEQEPHSPRQTPQPSTRSCSPAPSAHRTCSAAHCRSCWAPVGERAVRSIVTPRRWGRAWVALLRGLLVAVVGGSWGSGGCGTVVWRVMQDLA